MAVDLPPRRKKRSMSEMNVVPYIDVMLVLLIIFMVTAPMMTMGQIEVPSAGAAAKAPEQFIQVSVNPLNEITITDPMGQTTAASMAELVGIVKTMQGNDTNTPVIIAADKKLPYEDVVRILNLLQEQNVRRVGLLTAQ